MHLHESEDYIFAKDAFLQESQPLPLSDIHSLILKGKKNLNKSEEIKIIRDNLKLRENTLKNLQTQLNT